MLTYPLPRSPYFNHSAQKLTTNLLNATIPSYTQWAGITAAAGTRLAPISSYVHFLNTLQIPCENFSSLSLSLKIGKVTRLLLSVDIRVVSQTLSSESNPNCLCQSSTRQALTWTTI
jgi:hypothetical protein